MDPSRPPKQLRLDAHRNLYVGVLSNTDLMAVVTAFQGGIFDDMRSFVRLPSCVDWTKYFQQTNHSSLFDLTGIGGCFDAWLCNRSMEDVALLVKCLPWVRNMLTMVAIQRESLPLAHAIDISRCHSLIIRAGVQHACRVGSVPLVKLCYPHHKALWQFDDNACLVRGRSVDVLAYLSDLDAPILSPRTMDIAANFNCLAIVEWLHFNRNEGCTTRAMDYAAAQGHLGVVRFLHSHRPESNVTSAMKQAAANGCLEVVQFLRTHCSEGCLANALDYAALHGQLEAIKFLHQHVTDGLTTYAMDVAANNGHLEVVQFLHENRTEGCTTAAMNFAACNGHLEVVQFLHQHRTEGCTTHAMDDAARNGHLEVVKFLHDHSTEGCTTIAMDCAAAKGYMHGDCRISPRAPQ
ncbi:Aste57867_1780 [Aphanomyces stellatus]|uniref:Aste57867_1780 protein n=1 Tax=Aphanomyces stellatus TaxID=120398 RepID=A0A485K8M3_9STRA|nr:hypothetical protein As57867_001778 [Aphanomyces stellatus]VFT78989.1 Aste57867_1780 [Aphanomyces stellatus]